MNTVRRGFGLAAGCALFLAAIALAMLFLSILISAAARS